MYWVSTPTPTDPDEASVMVAADYYRGEGVAYFTHPQHPGRVLSSSPGGSERCWHGEKLSKPCADCEAEQ